MFLSSTEQLHSLRVAKKAKENCNEPSNRCSSQHGGRFRKQACSIRSLLKAGLLRSDHEKNRARDIMSELVDQVLEGEVVVFREHGNDWMPGLADSTA